MIAARRRSCTWLEPMRCFTQIVGATLHSSIHSANQVRNCGTMRAKNQLRIGPTTRRGVHSLNSISATVVGLNQRLDWNSSSSLPSPCTNAIWQGQSF
jgi:hypothetical protein